ncbi:MAG: MarR family transcriptional regulator [Bacteroidota bacterium]
MKGRLLDEQFAATIGPKYRSWGRIISVLKRQFNAWAGEILLTNGYKDFKMAYVSLLMNINPEGITNKELSEKAMISKQAMSKVVKELSERRYINTKQLGADKRCSLIYLTDKGKKLAIIFRNNVAALESEYKRNLALLKWKR